MIELIEVGAGHDRDRLRVAVEQTLSMSCHDAAAIQHSDERRELRRTGRLSQIIAPSAGVGH
jgi:hypothetical protein